jgi:Polyketide cyclase / dehydrase and lipid transport
MWTFEHHHDVATTPDQIWPLYGDVANWPLWDPAMERVDLDGWFVTGGVGTMHIHDTGAIAFTLTCVENERRFTTDSPGPGVSIVFDHLLVATADGHTTVTHRVIIDGPAADEVGPFMGPNICADLPDSMAQLGRVAEARAGAGQTALR